jgi:hypothetical protein
MFQGPMCEFHFFSYADAARLPSLFDLIRMCFGFFSLLVVLWINRCASIRLDVGFMYSSCTISQNGKRTVSLSAPPPLPGQTQKQSLKSCPHMAEENVGRVKQDTTNRNQASP